MPGVYNHYCVVCFDVSFVTVFYSKCMCRILGFSKVAGKPHFGKELSETYIIWMSISILVITQFRFEDSVLFLIVPVPGNHILLIRKHAHAIYSNIPRL